MTLSRRLVKLPLVMKKEEISDRDDDGLEQDQPPHETPLGLGCRILHSPKQGRLRQQKARDHLPRILSTKLFLKHDLLDRVFSFALRQRFQCLPGKSALKSFLSHSVGSLSETTCSRLPHFDGAEKPITGGFRRGDGAEPMQMGLRLVPRRHSREIATRRLP